GRARLLRAEDQEVRQRPHGHGCAAVRAERAAQNLACRLGHARNELRRKADETGHSEESVSAARVDCWGQTPALLGVGSSDCSTSGSARRSTSLMPGKKYAPNVITAPIAAAPPAASTRPSVPAEPWRSFLTTNGNSTSAGPRKTRYAIPAETSVPQSQARRRTNRSPCLSAARVDG